MFIKLPIYQLDANELVKKYGKTWTSVDDIKNVYTGVLGIPKVNT
jgi:hypothetical protein